MTERRFPARALSLGSLLLALMQAASLAEHATIPVAPLATYGKLDRAGVTVSGISSGAFFAHQFHVAYSGLVKGAGMVAGGLYACAEQVDDVVPPHPFTGIPKSVAAALAVCTQFGRTGFALSFWRFPDKPDAGRSREAALAARDGWARVPPLVIDRPRNKLEAISTARCAFSRCQFDEQSCGHGLKRLRSYAPLVPN